MDALTGVLTTMSYDQQGYWQGFLFILVVLCIILVAYLIKYAISKYNVRATPANINATTEQQKALCAARWMGVSQSRKGLDPGMTAIPDDQRLLINASVMATRLSGYLGPYNNGVFAEDAAVQLALASGSRCLIIEIDYDSPDYEPKLVYRDTWGVKQSLNTGDLNKVAKSIAARGFNSQNDGVPPLLANDPLFVILYVVRAPSQSTEAQAYMRYLGKIAEKLQPLKDTLVGQTPQGDFRRQALESQLFFTPYSVFKGRTILLTNVDTTGFRRLDALGLKGQLGPQQDLDFMIHCRLYGRESPTPFGPTSTPSNTVRPAAVITTAGYWLMTPPDREKEAFESTKQAWTLVMPPVATENNAPKVEELDRLYNSFGVHAIPFCFFDKQEVTDLWTADKRPFYGSAWKVKSELLRYVPPKPIPIQKPYPQANSDGGRIVAPKL
jgi:hypothetical protein